ncbi:MULTISPECIES: phosphoribosylamine--glycine ligase [unclassified Plantibacter]|uniref:phosphoribosylamine--glycine ligase n=1 Tax=unclassified Plantibacter TaxID=2624265 RepID=UPI003D34ECDE
MKILVLGSGAREHAIIKALLSEEAGHQIIAAPGNIGIAGDVTVVGIDQENPSIVRDFARDEAVDLVVIGPEAPLVAGVADKLRAAHIPVFGPNRSAAALEGSKSYAKRIMDEAGVPTGRAVRAEALDAAIAALDEFGAPYVVKADGLAAGKGVLVTPDRDAAIEHATYWLGYGGVLVEEFLEGPEVSLFFVTDGETVYPLSPAQDYKRLLNADAGPNTGGMGAYSPLPWLDERFGGEDLFVDEVLNTIAIPVVQQMASEKNPFSGLLYAGLIITERGIRVIEFNARFGDPETQVVLPRLVTPLSTLLLGAATGTLAQQPKPAFAEAAAVTVVLASENYPEKPVTGRPITGLDRAVAVEGVHLVHAATADVDGGLVATGGRVLNVVALGTTFTEARARAYEAIELIHLEGGQYRTDIAARVAD